MSNEFTTDEIALVIAREGGKCSMQGASPECYGRAQTANHRLNRSTGGRASLANAAAICHACNGLIESDADMAEIARERGVKLRPWDDPLEVPLLSPFYRTRVWLTDAATFFDPPAERRT